MNKSDITIDSGSLSKIEKAVMILVAPIFALVAGTEYAIARMTGLTYT